MHSSRQHALFDDINELTKEESEIMLSKTQNACCHDMHILFLFIKSLISLIKHQHHARLHSLTFINFRQVYLLLKVMFGNFFKMLNLSIRRSMNLLLSSYMLERRKPVLNTLFTLWGVESTVLFLANKFFKILNMLLTCCCLALPIILYSVLLDVGFRFVLKTALLEDYVDTPQSVGQCLMRIGSMQVCINVVTVKLHTPRLTQTYFI